MPLVDPCENTAQVPNLGEKDISLPHHWPLQVPPRTSGRRDDNRQIHPTCKASVGIQVVYPLRSSPNLTAPHNGRFFTSSVQQKPQRVFSYFHFKMNSKFVHELVPKSDPSCRCGEAIEYLWRPIASLNAWFWKPIRAPQEHLGSAIWFATFPRRIFELHAGTEAVSSLVQP